MGIIKRLKKRFTLNKDYLYSKKVKLPKKYWVKGKSKFLFCRLIEEGKSSINQLKPVKK